MIPRHIRESNANRTDTLVTMIKSLEKTDFKKKTGSGTFLRLANLDESPIGSEVVLRSEDLEEIKPLIIKSIKEVLTLRRVMLLGEIRDIDEVIGEQK